uniref:Uncharacterized protein n=1 Tax=Kalanchoe fedtschenkoi TaxID=63787 RepID=A0A7N0UJU6_KALFE
MPVRSGRGKRIRICLCRLKMVRVKEREEMRKMSSLRSLILLQRNLYGFWRFDSRSLSRPLRIRFSAFNKKKGFEPMARLLCYFELKMGTPETPIAVNWRARKTLGDKAGFIATSDL